MKNEKKRNQSMCTDQKYTNKPVLLKNGNRQFDLSTLPRCNAKTRSGGRCKHPGTKANGRCKRHGGRSTGARTQEGLKKCREINSIHGFYSEEGQERMRTVRSLLQNKGTISYKTMAELNKLLDEIETGTIPTSQAVHICCAIEKRLGGLV